MADIKITGTLYDTAVGHLLTHTDIVFTSGTDKIMGTTNEKGEFKKLIPQEPGAGKWEDLLLPRKGDWLLGPDTETYDTHYYFATQTVPVPANGDVGEVKVAGDVVKNARQLITYVANTFLAGRDIFLASVKDIPSAQLDEKVVRHKATETLRIVRAGLKFTVDPSPAPPLESAEEAARAKEYGQTEAYGRALESARAAQEARDRAEEYAREAEHYAMEYARSLREDRDGENEEEVPAEDQAIRDLCELIKGKSERGRRPFDNIPCALCYSRYSTNPTRLQTCLCCAPCQQ